jgi:catechol 2,3-dioxygenase-like lactoylglutathione lyase family enzyme
MGKLRHISISVDDIAASAEFYKQTFDLEEVHRVDDAVHLSDGVVSLVIIGTGNNPNSKGRRGLHHFGVLVDDLDDATGRVEANGGKHIGHIVGVGSGPENQRKFTDPDGIFLDVVNATHAERVWKIPVERVPLVDA